MSRILIVDDEAHVHYSFRRILGREMEVLSATNGQEALELVRTRSPDLVIMDVRMPGQDGIDALTRIKELDPELPVIIMTAYGTMQTAVEAMKFGAFEYILKPFAVDELTQRVAEVLNRHGRKS